MSQGGEGPGGRGPGSGPPSSYLVWMLHGWAERGGWCETTVPQHPGAAHSRLGPPLQTPAPPPGQGRVSREHCRSIVAQKRVCPGPSLVRGAGGEFSKAPRPTPPLLSPVWLHPRPQPEHGSRGQEVACRGVRDGAGGGSTAPAGFQKGKRRRLRRPAGGGPRSGAFQPPCPVLSLRRKAEGPQFPRGS